MATATAVTTTARSRSMAQCHFAHAPRPCTPRSSPPTPTLTICPHRAPSRGARKAFPAPRQRASAPPCFLTSSRHPTSALSILRLLCISSSSVIFLCFELPFDIALRVLYYPSLTLFFFKRSLGISVWCNQPPFASIASEIFILNTLYILLCFFKPFSLYQSVSYKTFFLLVFYLLFGVRSLSRLMCILRTSVEYFL